ASRGNRRRTSQAHPAGLSRSGLSPVLHREKARPRRPAHAHREPHRSGRTAVSNAHLALSRISGARSLRPLRSRLHRPSGSPPPAHVGGIQGPPHAPRLRRSGRLRIRTHPTRCSVGPSRGTQGSNRVRSPGRNGSRAMTIPATSSAFLREKNEEGWNRPPIMEPDGEAELLEVAMGPHHPSTHGVFRMDVALDGERVIRLKPVFGYLHRNHEKIAVGTIYLASMPYTDRLDYFCSLTNNWAYALAVEKLTGQEVPERAEYIRVILAELTRVQNHASSIGFLIQEMGASGTPLMYAFREREKILDLFEELTGARMMVNYMRFGGCRVDASPVWLVRTRKVVAGLAGFVDEYERLLSSNEILMAR